MREKRKKIQIKIFGKVSSRSRKSFDFHEKNLPLKIGVKISIYSITFSYFIFKFFRIKPNLRHFDAIIESAESDLFKALLTPNPRDFYVRNGSEGPCYPDNFFPQLNGDQRKIMSSCASMATSNPNTSQVAIVQGPPGTYNVYNTKKKLGYFWSKRW